MGYYVIVSHKQKGNMYNTLLYIGVAFLLSGFVLFIIATMMEAHYDRKLWKLKNERKYDQNK
jgi:hypothetical protein